MERSSLKLGQRFALALKAIAGDVTWPVWGGRGGGFTRLFFPGSRLDYAVEAGELHANAVVALALKWLGDRFPKPPIRVSRILANGDYQPLPKSPLVDLWNKPNANYGRRTLETSIAQSLICDGNAYIHKRRTRSGALLDLWWIPEKNVTPEWPEDASTFIDRYKVWTDRGDIYIPAEDMIHLRVGMDPSNQRLGFSPLKACLREVCALNEESAYVAAILRNMGVPGVAIIPDDPMLQPSKEDAERIKERYRDATSGDNRGDAIVMQGKYTLETLGFSPEQLAIKDLVATAMAKVAQACGTEPMSLGLPDPNKTFSNKEMADRSSWGSVTAMQDVIAEGTRYHLLPEFGYDPARYVVEYDYSGVAELNEAVDGIAQRVALLVEKKVITQNEGRELLGFEPLADDGADLLGGTPPPAPVIAPADRGDQPTDQPPPNPVKAWRYY